MDKNLKLGLIYNYNNKLCNSIEEDHDPKKENYSLVHTNLSLKDFYSGKYLTYLNYTNLNLKAFYQKHEIMFKDYENRLAEFAIYQPLLLETGELMAIKKNFWINIFIRKIKKYYANKLKYSNYLVYRNKIRYDYFNQIKKQIITVEKVILNTTFENVKVYVLQLNNYYKELNERNQKMNIKDENYGYEISFTIENCDKKMMYF